MNLNAGLLLSRHEKGKNYKRTVYISGYSSSTNLSKNKNFLRTSLYSLQNVIPLSLYYAFHSVICIWYLGMSILELTMPVSNHLTAAIPLGSYLIFNLCFAVYQFCASAIRDRKKNSQLCLVWREKLFTRKMIKDINVGDIILLQENEIVPADMLLIASGNINKSCYIDNSNVTGENDLQKRITSKETQALIDSLDVNEAGIFLNMIEGQVNIDDPNALFNEFSGKIKLRGSPKSENLTLNNLLLRESRIKAAPWVFGLVIYTGKETKISISSEHKSSKVSVFEKRLEFHLGLICLSVLLISLLHFLLSTFKSKEKASFSNFFLYVLLYHSAIPFPLLFVRKIGKFIYCKRLKNDENVGINNPDILENLGQIEYILVEKNGTLTNGVLKVRACIVNSFMYLVDQDYDRSPNEETCLLCPEIANAIEPIRKRIEENCEETIKYFMCLALCNSAYPQENDEFLVSCNEDHSLVKLASEAGVKLSYRDSKKAILSILDIHKEFKIILFKEPCASSKRTRILLYSFEDSKHLLFVKGPLEAMTEVVHSCGTRFIEDLKMSIPGIQIIILGIKVLSKKEAEEFLYSYNNARKCPVNREGRIEGVIEQCEEGLQWLGAVGIEDKIADEAKSTVQALDSAGIKFWIVSGDNEENSVSAGFGSDIIKTSSELLRVTYPESVEEVLASFEDLIKNKIFYEDFFKARQEANNPDGTQKLEEMKDHSDTKRFSKKGSEILRRASLHPLISQLSNLRNGTLNVSKSFNSDIIDYVLIIDGKCLDFALKSVDCLKCLTILLFLAKGVCSFNMLPNHKIALANILKHNFSFRPIFMGIGSWSDLGLLNESDISVSKQGSDITIQHFSDIKDLIFYRGINLYFISSKIVLLSLYFNVNFVVFLSLYHYMCGFSGTWVMNQEEIILYSLILQVVLFIPMYVYDRVISNSEVIDPEFYILGILNNMLRFTDFCHYLGLGALNGGLSAIFLYLTFENASSPDGYTSSPSHISIYLYIHFTLILVSITLSETARFSLPTIMSPVLVLLISLAYILLTQFRKTHELFDATKELFNMPAAALSAFIASFVILLVFLSVKMLNFFFCINYSVLLRAFAANQSRLNLPTRMQFFESNLGKVFNNSEVTKITENEEICEIDPYSLHFNSVSKEKIFALENSLVNVKTYSIYMQFYSICHIIIFMYSAFKTNQGLWSQIILLFCSGLLCCFSALQFTNIYKQNVLYYTRAFLLTSNAMTFFAICVLNSSFSLIFAVFPLFLVFLISNLWRFYMTIIIGEAILDICFKSLLFTKNTGYLLSEYAIVLVAICVIIATIAYMLEYSRRKEYLLASKVTVQMNKAKNVLGLLLPHFVMTRVKDGTRYISEDQGIVSVLFCNICDFEENFADLTPYELAGFLDELFGKFDQLCEIVGATKIETVGKTYMASAGLKDSEAELDPNLSQVSHARRVIELGFGMIHIIQKTKIKHNKLHVKIGINSGRVQAGVVGYHKPQFSLVGDTVNTASRMATTLTEKDCIQITISTYELVKASSGIIFEPHSSFVKGKGNMETFIVKIGNKLDTNNTDAPLGEPKLSMNLSSLSGIISSHSTIPPLVSSEQSSEKTKKKSFIAESDNNAVFSQNSAGAVRHINLFSYKCTETIEEKQFRENTNENIYEIFYIGLLSALCVYAAETIIEIAFVIEDRDNLRSINIWFSIVMMTGYAVLLKMLRNFHDSLVYSWALALSYMIPIGIIMLVDSFDDYSHTALTSIKIAFHALLLAHCSTLLFKHISVCILIVSLVWLLYIAIICPTPSGFLCLMFMGVCAVSIYHKEISMRVYENLKSTSDDELKKIQTLLTQMVPTHAYEHLMAEDFVIDKFSQVTMLYADIVGFTAWSSNRTPEEVVTMLNEMFTRFDRMCVEHNAYKVHTIGDCYVAMSNIGNNNRDPGQECLNVLTFAHCMIKAIEEVNYKYSMGISMRIGVHTGDVIGGITGKSIVRYDIYGIDSYIANQMESNGVAGHIAVSNVTRALISRYRPSLYTFIEHKTVTIFDNPIKIFLLQDCE